MKPAHAGLCTEGCRYRTLYEGSQTSLADMAAQQATALGRVGRLRNGLVNALKRSFPTSFAEAERAMGQRLSTCDDDVMLAYVEALCAQAVKFAPGFGELRTALAAAGVPVPAQDDPAAWATMLSSQQAALIAQLRAARIEASSLRVAAEARGQAGPAAGPPVVPVATQAPLWDLFDDAGENATPDVAAPPAGPDAAALDAVVPDDGAPGPAPVPTPAEPPHKPAARPGGRSASGQPAGKPSKASARPSHDDGPDIPDLSDTLPPGEDDDEPAGGSPGWAGAPPPVGPPVALPAEAQRPAAGAAEPHEPPSAPTPKPAPTPPVAPAPRPAPEPAPAVDPRGPLAPEPAAARSGAGAAGPASRRSLSELAQPAAAASSPAAPSAVATLVADAPAAVGARDGSAPAAAVPRDGSGMGPSTGLYAVGPTLPGLTEPAVAPSGEPSLRPVRKAAPLRPEMLFATPQGGSRTRRRAGGKVARTSAASPDPISFDVAPEAPPEPGEEMTEVTENALQAAVCIPRPVFIADLVSIAGSAEAALAWEQNCRADPDSAVRFIPPKPRYRARGSLVLPASHLRSAAAEFTRSWWAGCLEKYRGRKLYELAVLLHRFGDSVIRHRLGDDVVVLWLNQPRGLVGVVVVLENQLGTSESTRKAVLAAVEGLLAERLTLLAVLVTSDDVLEPIVTMLAEEGATRRWAPTAPVIAARSWEFTDDNGASATLVLGA